MIQTVLEEIKQNYNKGVFLQTKNGFVVDYLFQPGWLSGNMKTDRWSVYNTEFTTDQVARIVIETNDITIVLK